MVQRKVSNKFGIQADHVKSETRLANRKPSSYDGKSRGPDMKKKMKRSRSIKLSDIESLRSSSSSTLKQSISQPGKPPPLNVKTTAAIAASQKQIPARTTYGSPNYMKGTSSSEARKESSQVSAKRSSANSKSKLGSGPSNKPARTLTKSSSLKLVRTLTKTPSFKHVRAGSKKCSRVVLCADVNAQRATCSSTLKDSKFPDYLVLNLGGTEVEGTSVTKVCPYTYCSLNGHHHKPLPPLKCFLSARRRMLKTQKSFKLEALSPREVKPAGEKMEGVDAGQVVFYNKPAYSEGDLNSSPPSPPMQEGGIDFFIKTYAKGKIENNESIHGDFHEAEVEQSNKEQISEDLSAGSPRSEIDFKENLEQYSEIASMGANNMEGIPEKEKVEDLDKDYSAIAAQTEGVLHVASDFKNKSNDSSEESGSISEASNMEWEEGQFPALEIDTEAVDSMKNENESNFDHGYSSDIENQDLRGEPIAKSDNTVVYGSEKIQADEIFEEESACSETRLEDSDCEVDGTPQNLEIIESGQLSESDRESTTEDAETHLIRVMIASAWTEDPIVEPKTSIEERSRIPEAMNDIPGIGPQVGDVENYCIPEEQQKNKSLQNDDLAVWLQKQMSDSSLNSDETDQVITDEDYIESHENVDSKTDQNVVIGEYALEQEKPNCEAGDHMKGKEQVTVTKRSIGVQVPNDLFEAYQDGVNIDDNQNHNIIDPGLLENSAEDSNSSPFLVDEIIPAENQEQQTECKNEGSNVAENQNILDSEEESDSSMNKISLAESAVGEVEKMEVDDSSQSETTETLLLTGAETITKLKSTSLPLKSKSNHKLSITDGNQKWTIRSKRPATNEEEMRNFNPREPNFLPVVPDPDAEKVDLKHQMTDERKNSEEWMVDYALRQAVTKLAPARKRKVALLVEAFETVIPVPKFDIHLRDSSATFAPGRPIQACS